MSNFAELLISFETYCTVLAEEEFEKSIERLADRESSLIRGRTLFKKYLERCTGLARSDHIRAKYGPNLDVLAKHRSKGTQPSEEELSEAKFDIAIIELYRHIFGPNVVGSSPGQGYPDWQTVFVDTFQTKERFLQAIEPVTKAHGSLIRTKRGLDSYLNVLIKITDSYEHARTRIFDMGYLIGRYKISTELWEEQENEYVFRKRAELNRALADPNRKTGFVYIDRQGHLAHSYSFASTVQNSSGETITSQSADMSPLLLVPHTYSDSFSNPSQVALIDFGKHQHCRLKIMFQSKTTCQEPGSS